MRTPWFMHSPRGRNTLVGVYPTNAGTFVRSWKDGEIEVTWYAMGTEFPGGGTREAVRVIAPGRQLDEDAIDQAVEDFMEEHPMLCMIGRRTSGIGHPWLATRKTDTARQSRIDVLSVDAGDYVRTHRQGVVAIRFVPEGRGDEIEICRIQDACGDELALARADDRVSRHMAATAAVMPERAA